MKQENTMPTWRLDKLYSTADAWEKDFQELPSLAKAFGAFQGKLAQGAAVIRDAMQAQEKFSRLLDKLYVFAHCKADENTKIGENLTRLGKIRQAFAELTPYLTWFTPELLAIPAKAMARFLTSAELSFYRRALEETLRARKHTLSTCEEALLGAFSDVIGAPAKIFSALNDADLQFGKVKGPDGAPVQLTHGSYQALLQCENRAVRKAAFTKLHTVYKGVRNTMAQSLGSCVGAHSVDARTRKYASSLEAALFGDNIPETVYRQLIDTVHSKLPNLHRYFKLRRKILGLPRLDIFDMSNPIVPSCNRKYTWEEAVALVREALKPMGKEYCGILEKAFSEGWIDVPEREGKRSGGYSSGCYDSLPYILLNFEGTLQSVFTLIHELGHSMHSYYSRHTQEYAYADYRIFVAEVASTTNEILLGEYMLAHSTSKDERCFIISHLLNEIRATIYRQTQFAEFELMMHEHADKGEPLTADLLDKEYYDLHTVYYGFKANPLIAAEWSRIPHFYYNFYVYKYATGMAAAIRLANGILHGTDKDRQRYFGFLKAGSSKDVLDIMRDAGVDLSTPEPVSAALDYFGTLVKRLEKELL